jgi:toxin CptA
MNLHPHSVAFTLALLAAAAMGLALQRGGTCLVAAMEEIVSARRATRLLALLEAAAWVCAGLLVVGALGLMPRLPAAPITSGWTFLGAALLGWGALVNGACVFGTVARLGSGQWAYLATPAGFYAGCLTIPSMLALRLSPAPSDPSASFAALSSLGGPRLAVAVVAGVMLLRLGLAWRSLRARSVPVWTPHRATASIGVAFLALLLLAGAWSYTDVLAELAQSMRSSAADGVGPRLALAAALLAGALAGGRLHGVWSVQMPPPVAWLRCFLGGWMLGCGSLLVPGGNDSLVLLGLPLFWPHAWVSVAVMCAVVAAGLWARRMNRPCAPQEAGSDQP